jgi:putative ABC transport system permease protein
VAGVARRHARPHRVVSAVTPLGRSIGLAVQTAGTLALLFAAMAFGKNLRDIYAIDPGYRPTQLVWSTLDRQPDAASGFDGASYTAALTARAAEVPGVAAAAVSASFPIAQLRTLTALTPVSRPGTQSAVPMAHARVSAGFFATLGVAMVEGHDVRDDATAEVVLNREAARLLFPGESPVGHSLTLRAGPPMTIVGVVTDFSLGDLRLAGVPVVFSAVAREPALLRTPILVVRTTGTASLDLAALSAAVRVGGRHLIGPVRPVWGYLTGLLARERLVFGLAALLAAVAVIVTGAALFATLAFEATRRQRDMAIRLAVGASPAQAAVAVWWPLVLAVGTGTVTGLPMAWAVARAGQTLLHRTSPWDPWVVVLTVLALSIMTLVAAVVPARRVWRLPVAHHLNAAS